MEIESGGGKEPLTAPTYQRIREQETLITALSLEQLRKLAAGGASLVMCTTRIDVGETSTPRLKALLQAIDPHIARKQPVKAGDALSL